MNILNILKSEITNYIGGSVNVRGVSFSTYETIQKIERFSNCQYKNGNTDSLGNIKYWYDISLPAVMNEVKNIDFDTKDITIESDGKNDGLRKLLSNLKLKKWMRDNEEGVRINEIIEESSGWGNVVLKKSKNTPYYDKLDLTNIYVINQLARSISGESPDSQVIERHIMTQSDLREMKGIWDDEKIEYAIKELGDKGFMSGEGAGSIVNDGQPYYEVYERNGETSLADLKEAQGLEREEGDEEQYTLAKIVAIINKSSHTKSCVLFAGKISEMPYFEYHRGKYDGRWLRKGIYEILFDIQMRANECGNQIARALEFGGHQIFQSPDTLIFENILTDLKRGDIIKTSQLSRVDMSSYDINQYITEWNKLIELRNSLTNSSEIVEGTTPAGTPFKLGRLMNANANKFYDFIREKLGLCIESVYNKCVLPNLLKNFKLDEAIMITGDSDIMKRYFEMRVESWYIRNLWKFPPHDEEMAKAIKEQAMSKVMANKSEMLKIEKGFWDDFKPRASVVITGEGSNIISDLDTLATFIQLEADPIRRSALIEMAMKKKNIDIEGLPKTEQPEMAAVSD